jgi:hypothetical protein
VFSGHLSFSDVPENGPRIMDAGEQSFSISILIQKSSSGPILLKVKDANESFQSTTSSSPAFPFAPVGY